jgi:TolB-like protein/DNA-binding winged helix-turn-helix (wHTH) protein/Flp pilus assembly protein TadD
MELKRNSLLSFGPFRVDADAGVVLRENVAISLPPKAVQVLLTFLRNSDRALTREELMSVVWGDTFVEEANLTQAISVLRKALGDDPHQPKYIITIPRRGYRFGVEVHEVQPTADHVNPESDGDAVYKRRPWVAGAIACVMIALSAVAWWRDSGSLRSHILRRVRPVRIQSIAVLPVRNLSGSVGQEYFSDGVTEALITSLAQIHALKVISRTSVMRYKNTTKSLPEIGAELKVDAVLEGSVQRQADRLRISAQLIEAATDTHLWAADYEGAVTNVLQLESSVAKAVAREIRVRVTPEESMHLNRVRNVALTAEDAYLRARYEHDKRDETHLEQAIEHYRRAIQIEPDFAAAYAGLAVAWIQRGVWGAMAFRDPEVQARNAAIKAIELDPNLAEAHAALAHTMMFYDSAWVSAEQQFRRALELDTNNVYAHVYYASLLEVMGRFSEGIAEAQYAASLDPLSSVVESECGRVLFRARRYDEAIQRFQHAIELDPQDFGAYTRLAEVYEQNGQFQKALGVMEEAFRIRDGQPVLTAKLGRTYALLGRRSDALNVLRNVAGPRTNPKWLLDISLAYFALGNHDQGFEWLTKAVDQRQMAFLLGIDPRFDSVRTDPRFDALQRRLGLPASRLSRPNAP